MYASVGGTGGTDQSGGLLSFPSWRFSAVDSTQGHSGFFTAAGDIMQNAQSKSAHVTAAELIGDEYHIHATGHVDESDTFTFTMKLTRLEQKISEGKSYKVHNVTCWHTGTKVAMSIITVGTYQ